MRTFLAILVVVIGSAAVAIGAVMIAGRGFDRLTADSSPNARLLFAVIAPLGVVLFGLLVERAGRVVDRVMPGNRMMAAV
jgi:hypothetical protein